jgi:hypothetical protein
MSDFAIQIRRGKPSKKVGQVIFTTTFEDFFAALAANDGDLRTMHSALWHQVPSERLLSDGAWLLMNAVAAKYGWMFTHRHDVREVANRVNRLVSVGLLLRFGTSEAAAKAFVNQVFGAINRAVTLGYRPGQTLKNETWRELMAGHDAGVLTELRRQGVPSAGSFSAFSATPAYLFFADCFKAARMLGEELKAGQGWYNQQNTVTSHVLESSIGVQPLTACYLKELDLNRTISYLDPATKEDWGDGYSRRETELALASRAELKLALLKISTWRAVPIDFVGVPRSIMFMKDRLIVHMWLRARFISAAKPRKRELEPHAPDQWMLTRLRAVGADSLIEFVTAVALERGAKWTAQQLACFRQMAAEELDSMMDWAERDRLALKAAGLFEKNSRKVQINPQLATLFVTGQAPELEAEFEHLNPEQSRKLLLGEILPRVDWTSINIQRFAAMLEVSGQYSYFGFTKHWIAKQIKKLPRQHRAQAVDLLLSSVSNRDVTRVLLKQELLVVDSELVNQHLAAIPTNSLVAWLESELSRTDRLPSETVNKIGPRTLVRACLQLKAVRTHALWARSDCQAAWLELVRLLSDPAVFEPLKIDANMVTALRHQQVGESLWQSYLARL